MHANLLATNSIKDNMPQLCSLLPTSVLLLGLLLFYMASKASELNGVCAELSHIDLLGWRGGCRAIIEGRLLRHRLQNSNKGWKVAVIGGRVPGGIGSVSDCRVFKMNMAKQKKETVPLNAKKRKHNKKNGTCRKKNQHTITNNDEKEEAKQDRSDSAASVFLSRGEHDITALGDIVRVLLVAQTNLRGNLLTENEMRIVEWNEGENVSMYSEKLRNCTQGNNNVWHRRFIIPHGIGKRQQQ